MDPSLCAFMAQQQVGGRFAAHGWCRGQIGARHEVRECSLQIGQAGISHGQNAVIEAAREQGGLARLGGVDKRCHKLRPAVAPEQFWKSVPAGLSGRDEGPTNCGS